MTRAIIPINLPSAVDGGHRGAINEAGPDAVYAGLVLLVPASA